MNILFFSGGAHVGGMEVVLQGLMATLNKLGHRTLAIVSGWNNGDYPDRLRASGISFEEIRLGRFHRSRPLWTLDTLRNLPSAALKLHRIADEFCPDLVVYPDPQILMMGSTILPKKKNVLYLHNKPSGLLSSRYAEAVIRRADRIVCVSNFVAACLGQTALDTKKIVVVHNGIESPAENLERIRRQEVLLGIIGQVTSQKRHLLLIEALSLVKTRALDVQFILEIIGEKEGAYAEAVDELVERLNMWAMVKWVGFQNIRDDIYRDLDIVVAPATDEALGLTLLEAGAYGLAVVASRSGGLPEVIVDGETGLLVKPDDAGSLAAALEKLIVDAPLRVRLGRAGRAHVSRNFTLEQMAEKFVAAVDSVHNPSDHCI